MSHIKYEGIDKNFVVKRKLKKSFIYILMSIILLVITTIAGMNTFKVTNNYIDYNEIGKIDYKVYLQDNTYYDKEFFTKSDNMSFVSNLIKTVNVDFMYEIVAEQEISNTYDYVINAELVIYDKDDQTKVLFSNKEVLKEDTVDKFSKDRYLLKEGVDIDYAAYNQQVLNFKKDYSLSVVSELILTMDINSTLSVGSDSVSNKNAIKVSIPLNVQTLDIDMVTSEFNNPKVLGNTISGMTTFNLVIFAILVVATLIVIGLYISSIKTGKKDIYVNTIKKYLRQYDRVIISSKQPNLNESRFDQKIRIMSIEELIDAHDTLGKPILYYEVIPNEKSYFIIIADGVLYKLTISRAYLEKQELESKTRI